MTCARSTCPGVPEAGRKYCGVCLAAFRLKGKARAERHEAAGLCARCALPRTRGRFCDHHAERDLVLKPRNGRPHKLPGPRGDAFAEAFKKGQRPGQIARAHGVKVSLVCDALIVRKLWTPRRRAA